jgi:aspartyl-tRNA(Asn)/glutamyl-tRNA(Gln) amidotransferase subunit A
MAGEAFTPVEPAPLAGLRIALLQGLVLQNHDHTVGQRYPAALTRLSKAGVHLHDQRLSLIDAMAEVNAKGGISPPESFMIHRDRLARRADDIDPNVRVRIVRGGEMSAADYVETMRRREELVRAMGAAMADFDAFVWPTTPIVAPTIAEMEDTKVFSTNNGLLLRNTAMVNFLDLCAISLPMPGGGLPCGLMLVGRNGSDRRLFRIAAAVERVFAE